MDKSGERWCGFRRSRGALVIGDGSDPDLKNSRVSTYFDDSFSIGAAGQVKELQSAENAT